MLFIYNSLRNILSHKDAVRAAPARHVLARKSPPFLVLVVLLGILAACGSSPTVGTTNTTPGDTTNPQPTDTATSGPTATLPTATPTLLPGPTATAKPAPVNTVLFHSDATTGFANWNPSGPWKIFNNILVNDGTGSSTNCGGDIALLAPYQPTTPDVKIVADIQFPQNYNEYGTGFVARVGSVQNMVIGYSAYVTYAGFIDDVNGCNNISLNNSYNFQPSQSVHRFEMDIKGTDMKFYIDGGLVVAASDAKYLGAGAIGIFTNREYIKVSSFTVSQL